MDLSRVSSFVDQQWILLPLLMLALAFVLFWVAPLIAQAAFMREYRRRPPCSIGPERPRSVLGKMEHQPQPASEQENSPAREVERHAA